MWIVAGLISAFLLGLYDVSRKYALKDNAVIPVLFLSCLTGAFIFSFPVIFSFFGLIKPDNVLYVPEISLKEHFLFFLKSMIVGSSWFFAYYAIRYLPLTIVVPIRATGPMWTLMGALIIYSEKFNTWQWIGIIIVLTFFYVFSLSGHKEGIDFKRNKWIYFIVIATLLGAISSLYDKYLIRNYDRIAVQAWFSIYMVPVFAPFLFFVWFPKRKSENIFAWKWTIHLIGILLILADFFYFYALSVEDSKIALLSVLRRSSVIISFVFGALIFHEKNIKRKGLALAGILTGVILILLGSIW